MEFPAYKLEKIPVTQAMIDAIGATPSEAYIVDTLDHFEKLCNDISEGLPAEIEARQKQYEYYRDKLLTFKKKEAVENEQL